MSVALVAECTKCRRELPAPELAVCHLCHAVQCMACFKAHNVCVDGPGASVTQLRADAVLPPHQTIGGVLREHGLDGFRALALPLYAPYGECVRATFAKCFASEPRK